MRGPSPVELYRGLTLGRRVCTGRADCLLYSFTPLTTYHLLTTHLLLTCRKGSVYHASASALYSPSAISSCGVVSAGGANARSRTFSTSSTVHGTRRSVGDMEAAPEAKDEGHRGVLA